MSYVLSEALSDERVARALELAVRDAGIRHRFRLLRRQGEKAVTAVEQIADEVCLSEERVRSIVYRKGQRGEEQ